MADNFKVGDWIIRKMNGNVGWITSKNERGFMDVEFLDGSSTPNLQSFNLESYEAILPEVTEEAKKVFVDLALMTKDEDWFREVTGQ